MSSKLPYILGGAAVLGIGYVLYKKSQTPAATTTAPESAGAKQGLAAPGPAKPLLTKSPSLLNANAIRLNPGLFITQPAPQGGAPAPAAPTPENPAPSGGGVVDQYAQAAADAAKKKAEDYAKRQANDQAAKYGLPLPFPDAGTTPADSGSSGSDQPTPDAPAPQDAPPEPAPADAPNITDPNADPYAG